MSKVTITPPKIVATLLIGVLLMWIPSLFQHSNWLLMSVFFIGWLIVAITIPYCMYQLYKSLRSKTNKSRFVRIGIRSRNYGCGF